MGFDALVSFLNRPTLRERRVMALERLAAAKDLKLPSRQELAEVVYANSSIGVLESYDVADAVLARLKNPTGES